MLADKKFQMNDTILKLFYDLKIITNVSQRLVQYYRLKNIIINNSYHILASNFNIYIKRVEISTFFLNKYVIYFDSEKGSVSSFNNGSLL